jgi:teichuronic acid biosynthesis glycosyltransferase TuaC
VDLGRFTVLDRGSCRSRLGFHPDRFHVLVPASAVGDPRKRVWLARSAVARLNDRGLNAELHELSNVPHTEVPIWLNACDALILTSLHEGSPNVVKEALACDLPVVSVDVGDVRERIEAIPGCYLSDPSAEDLAAALTKVHEGSRRVAGRQQMEDLSNERIAERIRDFYEQVLTRGTAGTGLAGPSCGH